MADLSYRALTARTDAPAGSVWGLFGAGDQRGSVNFMTPETVLGALGTVRGGQVIGLDHPLDAMPDNPARPHPVHTITSRHADARDDYLDGFYLQCSSHIDGLRHRRHGRHGFYNGVPAEHVGPGTDTLGVGAWASTGIVGRGVLLDVARSAELRGAPISPEDSVAIGPEELERVAAEQGTVFRPGDLLMVRTGWCEHVLSHPESDYVRSGRWRRSFPGLVQSEEMLAWLWDHRFVLVAADNVALEVAPPVAGSPFHASNDDDGYMHQHLIALLGMVIGELWKLDELAAACAADGRYECAVVVKPLNLPGGVGSPANAVALR